MMAEIAFPSLCNVLASKQTEVVWHDTSVLYLNMTNQNFDKRRSLNNMFESIESITLSCCELKQETVISFE